MNTAINKNNTQNKNSITTIAIIMIAAMAFAPEMALAAGGNPLQEGAQWVLDMLNNGFTRTLAIIAVISCGIMGFFGRLSWDWAWKIVAGIVVVFGAASIVDALSGLAS